MAIFILFFVVAMMMGCDSKNDKGDSYTILFIKEAVNGITKREEYIKSADDTLNRKLLSFDNNGKIRELAYMANGKITGSYIRFYPDGDTAEKGMLHDSKKYGVFSYYRDKTIHTEIDYILFAGSEKGYYANQKYKFAHNGDTILKESNFFEIKAKDTIKNGEDYTLHINIVAPAYPLSGFVICDYDSLYALKSKLCDTIRMHNHRVEYAYRSYKLGKNVIRGMIYDYEQIDNGNGEFTTSGHEFYFSKKFYVR